MPFHTSRSARPPGRACVRRAAGLAALSLACSAALVAQAPTSPAPAAPGQASAPAGGSARPQAPEWAYPGTATRTQVPPPPDFRRASTHYKIPLGIFEGQSDVGTAVVPGSASFDAATGKYTITSAGYNVWYYRDEFRFLWKRMSGDVSLAADIAYPDPNGYGDRKAVLVIRQDLADDSPQVVVAPHGAGMIQLAQRPTRGARVADIEFRVGSRGARPGGNTPDSLVPIMAKRVGLEKRGDSYALFVSLDGEPMHQFGAPITQKIDGPFYVGIGFCSHLPDTVDTAVISNVVLENAAGRVR
jgi:hypothetical protein